MEKTVRVRVPQVVSIDTAIEVYYSKIYLRNKDIEALFGKLGQARVVKLKELAREVMREKDVMAYDATTVDTRSAYIAWGLDIGDLEKRHRKLADLEKRRVRA